MSVVSIQNALFKAFARPISLEIKNYERWAIVGRRKTALLEILAGKHTAEPPVALRFPLIGESHWPSQVIEYVNFAQNKNKAPYVGARYESFRDEFDYSLRTMLERTSSDRAGVDRVMVQLHLSELADRWIVELSNGQTRRAALALALLKDPELLVVDDPFLGLDPKNRALMDQILHNLPIPVIIGLVSAHQIPNWITNVAIAAEDGVSSGSVEEHSLQVPTETKTERTKPPGWNHYPPVVELEGVSVAYKGRDVIRDLHLVVRKGERVHIKGPNGSGKSTLLALITADHPQSWNEKVKLFGEPREVGKQSYHGINSRIGHSAPELHSIFPRHLTVAHALATGFGADFMLRKLTPEQQEKVERWIARLGLAPNAVFGGLSATEQKLVLFARALIKDPDILILDEAFSTFDTDNIQKAFEILDEFSGAVLLVGHVPEEIPPVDKTLELTPL